MYSHCPYLTQKLSVMHIIKEALYIDINNNVKMISLHMFFCLSKGIFHASIGAKAVACITKLCFTNWLHDLQNTLLYQPIQYGRDSQWAGFSVNLGNFHTLHCLWLIPNKFLLYGLDQYRLRQVCQIQNGFSISPRRFTASVLFQIPIC